MKASLKSRGFISPRNVALLVAAGVIASVAPATAADTTTATTTTTLGCTSNCSSGNSGSGGDSGTPPSITTSRIGGGGGAGNGGNTNGQVAGASTSALPEGEVLGSYTELPGIPNTGLGPRTARSNTSQALMVVTLGFLILSTINFRAFKQGLFQ